MADRSRTIRQVRDLARRALVASQRGEPLQVSPEEYGLLRNAETETWDAAIIEEWGELGLPPSMLGALDVIVVTVPLPGSHEHCDWPSCACWCGHGPGTRPHPEDGHHAHWGPNTPSGSADGYPSEGEMT